MAALSPALEAILLERFGQDTVIALATVSGGIPFVRSVNAYYEDGAFYVLTYALSGKMQHIAVNPAVAVSGDWFTAHGTGENLGWFGSPENISVAGKMRDVFSGWIDNGHNNFEDVNTCVLRIRLTEGVLFSDGRRYDIEFSM